MKARIESELRVLVGLPLSASYRAGTLAMFHFGVMRRDRGAMVGERAIHVQCSWRLRGPDDLVAGSGDADDANLRQLIVDREDDPLVVRGVEADDVGTVDLAFADGYALQIFPDAPAGEFWRFFAPGSKAEHFVVSAAGLE